MGVLSRVPKLNIRPRHLIEVYASNINKPIPLLREGINVQTIISSYLSDAVKIGTIQSITITSEREVGFYRTLNAEHLGKIRETYPHLPKYSAHVKNVVFYDKHLLNVFQATTKTGDVFSSNPRDDGSIVPTFNIYNQIAPLIIKITMYEPGIENDELAYKDNYDQASRTLILWDCWFKESTIEFDVEEDIFMVQESDITFAWLTSM